MKENLAKEWGLLPRSLPYDWKMEGGIAGCDLYTRRALRAFVSASLEADGKRWLHVSTSRKDRMPNWTEFRAVKDLFIGLDKLAVQVFPPQSQYVNFHPNALHLWHCLDGDPVPDFRTDGLI